MKKIFDAWQRFSNPLKTKTVLVIDDSEVDRILVSRALSKYYHILTASGGREGVALAVKEKPDLIVLDFMMPDVNGPDVCRQIRADASLRDIPVIFLTSIDTPHAVVEGLEQEADAYLTKPVKVRDLIEEVSLRINTVGPRM